MKRIDLIRALEGLGCEFVATGVSTTGIVTLQLVYLSRFRAIERLEGLARRIIKVMGNPHPPIEGVHEDEDPRVS